MEKEEINKIKIFIFLSTEEGEKAHQPPKPIDS